MKRRMISSDPATLAHTRCILLMAAFVLVAICPQDAFAATAIGNAFCNASFYMHSNVARGLGTVAILSIGFGALFGRISFGSAALIMVGVAALFGAPDIINAIIPWGVGCPNLTS